MAVPPTWGLRKAIVGFNVIRERPLCRPGTFASKEIQLGEFIFVVCQNGAETPIKHDLMASSLGYRLAFSRPGLLTFKAPAPIPNLLPEPQSNPFASLRSAPLIRLLGAGLGNIHAQTELERIDRTLELAGTRWDGIHVFRRDPFLPGSHEFEPGQDKVLAGLVDAWRSRLRDHSLELPINAMAQPGQRLLDVIVVEPDCWYAGCHQANGTNESWPGGSWPVVAPTGMISRAYLKIAEALAWSGLPVTPDDWVVEIGSSPGGACQRLLDLGLRVTGVDPAAMDERILKHPRFEHWRGKAATIKRKRYAKFRWLVADANVAPNYTLDVVGDILQYPGNQIEGILLTLKLSSWEHLDDLPKCLSSIRELGFDHVAVRQLASNRRECCLMGLRRRSKKPRAQRLVTAAAPQDLET